MFRAFTASGALRQTFIDRILSLSLLRVSKSLSKIGCTKRAFLKRRVRRISFVEVYIESILSPKSRESVNTVRVRRHRTCVRVCAGLREKRQFLGRVANVKLSKRYPCEAKIWIRLSQTATYLPDTLSNFQHRARTRRWLLALSHR